MNVQDAASLTIPEGNVRNIHDKNNQLLWSAVGYDVKYKGDTAQQTYGGKNLFNRDAVSLGSNWGGSVGSTCYPFASQNTCAVILVPVKGETTYTVKLYSSEWYSMQLLEASSSYTVIKNHPTTPIGKEFTYTLTTMTNASYIGLKFKYGSAGTTVITQSMLSELKLQLEAGSTATSYEPYVGGIPAPNPDYPQNVNVVQGAQSVKITGRNILPNNITTQTFHGVDITRNSDNSLTLNGTVDLGSSNYHLDIGQLNAKKDVTYTISGISGWSASTLQIYTSSSVAFPYGNRLSCSNGPKTVTAMGDEVVNVGLYFYEGQVYENVTVYPMIEVSNSVSAYEPYQGQTFSVDLGSIELCKIGNYQDYIAKSSGKNIWGGYTQYLRSISGIDFTTNSDGTITAQGTASANAYSITGQVAAQNNTYIPLAAGTYYLSSKETLPAGVTLQVVETSNSITLRDGVGSFTLNQSTDVTVRLKIGSGTNLSNGITVYPQLEAGSTATPYEPYGTDWYVYKEIGKTVLDGSEQWDTYNGGYRLRVYNALGQDNQGVSGPILSDNFTATSYSNVSNSVVKYGIALRATVANGIAIRNKDCADVAAFKSWLGTHNTTAYYALATPTYTKITDATLISQLNAIHDWLRRYDYYGAVSGNLPIIIDRTGII